MARRYTKVTVWMIADINIGTGLLIRDDVTNLITGMQAIEAGEVEVEVEVHGDVKVNTNGYAIPWVGPR